jgi:hypothetical protein
VESLIFARLTKANKEGKEMFDGLEDFLWLEWEALGKPVLFDTICDNEKLPKQTKKIEIQRNQDYNLQAILFFKDNIFYPHSNGITGSFKKGFEVNGSDSRHRNYTLESCHVGATHIKIGGESQDANNTAELSFDGIRINYPNSNEGVHLREWYLNGPSSHIFSSYTIQKMRKIYLKERFEIKDNKIDHIEVSSESESHSTNSILVKLTDFQFLISKVPTSIGPPWSSNISFDYRTDWGRIPEINEREKIEELCSFIFGKHLMRIGNTLYDKDEAIVTSYAHNAWGHKAKSYCSNPEYPPINLGTHPPQTGKIISDLFSAYSDFCDILNLKEALWNYWISSDIPAGTNLTILAAALECIINQWFKLSKSRSKGVFIDTSKFLSLIQEEIISIGKKLNEDENKEKILAKIENANSFGIMERYRIFFEEIKLGINENEWSAILERHKFVHGQVKFKEADWEKVIQHHNSLQTLFNKVILKILGYDGNYDRSTLGWKETKLT